MELLSLLKDKSVKATEKRDTLIEALTDNTFTLKGLAELLPVTDDKSLTIVLKTVEAVTNTSAQMADIEWLRREKESGVKNQYGKALKKASRLRA